ATMLPLSLKQMPPNILTSLIAPAPARAARISDARRSSFLTRGLRCMEECGQTVECGVPAFGVASGRAGQREILVANEEQAAVVVGRDADRHLRLQVGVLVGRLDDPGEDDTRWRRDLSIDATHDHRLPAG